MAARSGRCRMPARGEDTPAPDGEDAAGPDGTPYPAQPVDGERPVPLRGRPERTQDPQDWNSSSLAPITGRSADEAAEELVRRTQDVRASLAEGRAGEPAPASDEESSYASEQEQGAAQPGPNEQ